MDQRAVGFLLGLIDADADARIRRRIGAPRGASERRAAHAVLKLTPVPSSVLVWIQNDPKLDAVVHGHGSADQWMRRAVPRGIPFGPGRGDPLPVDRVLLKHADEPPVPQCSRPGW
jgi:hypothetical protein